MNAVARQARGSTIEWIWPRRRLVFGGLAVVLLLAASTFGRPWLEALGIGSVVLSLLPCAAMCAAGLCMKGGNCAKQAGTDAKAASGASPDASAPS